MTAAKRMSVSGYSHVDGAQVVRKPMRMAPLSPAIALPTMNTVIFMAMEFLPSALAASSRSRIARNERPYGELMMRGATRKTTKGRIREAAPDIHRYESE